MRLHKITICLDFSYNLKGITFTLKTQLEEPPVFYELDSLGVRYGNNCQELVLPEEKFIKYLQVSYGSNGINAVLLRTDET